MRIVISYDISDNKRRRKIAKILEGYGYRVQYSIFECDLDARKLRQLKKRLRPYVEADQMESIRVYPLTADAAEKVDVIGVDLRRLLGPVIVI